MKTPRYTTTGILAAGALLLAGSTQLQAAPTNNLVIAQFATGTQGENSVQDGTYGQWTGDCLEVPYGIGTIWWDGITYDAADGSTGSAKITAHFNNSNNTDLLVSMAPGYNNWFYQANNGVPGWTTSGTNDFSQYVAVQFDILWDTNSSLTVDQFNTGTNWPASYLVNGSPNYMNTNSYYTHGVNVDLFTGSGGATVQLGTFLVPAAAAYGWTTVTMPYSDSLAGIDQGAGLWFQGANGSYAGVNGDVTAGFWIDNLVLLATTNAVVVPPPSLSISKTVQGLNLFTANGPALNNRESLEATNYNYSWIGASGPVSYSFTISSYPVPGADQVQNHIFLVPNATPGSAPDYADSNLVFLDLENYPGGSQWLFRYKTNEPNGNTMVYGSGTIASISGPAVLGTYTVTFNNNLNVTMTSPNGSTNFAIPDDAAGDFVNTFSNNVALFYGSQANNAAAENDHTVTSEFKVSGLGAADFDDNFVADEGVLDTNIWEINASAPVCVDLVGPGSPYWVSWTLPASRFVLEAGSSLKTIPAWSPVTSNPSFAAGANRVQLISTNDLPAGSSAFFALLQRNVSQLQVLMPGETNAPGTPTGKTGSPTPVSLSAGAIQVTVNACDQSWHIITSVNDFVQLSSSDVNATPEPGALVQGTGQIDFSFADTGTWTVTATDTSNPNILPNTGSPTVVNP